MGTTRLSTDEQPIVPESLRTVLLEPLASAVRFVLGEMAKTDVSVRTQTWGTPPTVPESVCVEVPLTAASLESLVMSFPAQTAAALASRMLATVTEETDSKITPDCMCELANVVAGQAKALFAHTPFQLSFSVPRVLIGSSREFAAERDDRPLVITFDSELGEFTLELHQRNAEPCSSRSPRNANS